MTRQEMDKYKDTKPVAVFPMDNWGGIEILAIEYGINDYVVYRENYGKPEEKLHRALIRVAASHRSFFIYNSERVYLDQCMRVG